MGANPRNRVKILGRAIHVKHRAVFGLLFICMDAGMASADDPANERPAPEYEPPAFAEFLLSHATHIAHRGGAANWPEHTLFAYEKSILEAQSEILEVDIRLSADEEIVIIHDSTVDRTTDGTGLVSDFDLEELRNLDAGFAYSQDGQFPYINMGLGIPSLQELFAATDGDGELASSTPLLNISLQEDGPVIESKLVSLIETYDLQDRVCLGSQDDGTTRRLKEALPGICTFYPVGAALCFAAEALSTGDIAICPRHDVLALPYEMLLDPNGEALITEARDQGTPIIAWTVNDQESMEELLEAGVDGIMSDDALLLRDVLND